VIAFDSQIHLQRLRDVYFYVVTFLIYIFYLCKFFIWAWS